MVFQVLSGWVYRCAWFGVFQFGDLVGCRWGQIWRAKAHTQASSCCTVSCSFLMWPPSQSLTCSPPSNPTWPFTRLTATYLSEFDSVVTSSRKSSLLSFACTWNMTTITLTLNALSFSASSVHTTRGQGLCFSTLFISLQNLVHNKIIKAFKNILFSKHLILQRGKLWTYHA